MAEEVKQTQEQAKAQPKYFVLMLSEIELSVIWQMLQQGAFQGKDAGLILGLQQKVQQAVPVPATDAQKDNAEAKKEAAA